MPMPLINAFQGVISPHYLLPKAGAMFEIIETAANSSNKKVLIGGSKGIGFTLDQPTGGHSWKFICPNPLSGVVSVCDGILILNYSNKNYIIVMDMKSKNTGKAIKQIKAGIILCEWLYSILKLHSHTTESYEFVGLVCKSRGAVSKRTFRKGLKADLSTYDKIPYLTVSNPGTIHIKDILQLITP